MYAEKIQALALISAIGKEKGSAEKALHAIRITPCNANNCPFGSLDEFLNNISDLAELNKAGKIDEQALKDFHKVIEDLGHINGEKAKNAGQVNFFMARGAAGVVTSIKNLTDKGYKIKGFEVTVENSNAASNSLGKRRMDITATAPDGKTVQIEVKSYDGLENAKRRVIDSLNAKTQPDDKGKPGQFRKDLVSMAKNGGGTGDDNRLWMFAYDEVEAKKSEIAKAVIEEIEVNAALRNHLIRDVTGKDLPEDFEDITAILEDDIYPAVEKIFKSI